MTKESKQARLDLERVGVLLAGWAALGTAILYLIGLSEQNAFLGHFGVKGAVNLEFNRTLALGALHFGMVVILTLAMFLPVIAFSVGLRKMHSVASGEEFTMKGMFFNTALDFSTVRRTFNFVMFLSFVVLCIIISSTLVGWFSAVTAERKVDDGCNGCVVFELGDDQVFGLPLSSDEERVVVLRPDGAVRLLPWEEVVVINNSATPKKQGVRGGSVQRSGR